MAQTQSTKNKKTKRSPYRNIPLSIRKLIIDKVAVEGVITQAEAARRYGQHTPTISNILDNWYLEGRIDKKPRGGRRRKLLKFENKHGEYIKNLLDEDCIQTLDVIKDKLINRYPDLADKSISSSGLWRYMSRLGLSLKRKKEVERRGEASSKDMSM